MAAAMHGGGVAASRRPAQRLRPWLAALLAASLLLCSPASAIDAKCSACSVVAGELRSVLESEKHRDPIDLRGRLDSKGVRYGKVIDFRMSELRVIELLEGLCERVGDFALWTPSAAWTAANPDESAERRWVRIKGDGAHVAATQDEGLRGAKAKAMHREIEAYCGRLIEETEEQLAAAVRAEAFNATEVETLLCEQLSRACRGPKRRAPRPKAVQSEEAANGDAPPAGKDEL